MPSFQNNSVILLIFTVFLLIHDFFYIMHGKNVKNNIKVLEKLFYSACFVQAREHNYVYDDHFLCKYVF